MVGDLFDSPWKILIVAVVIIVLFGSKKLPQAARSLGHSMRIMKKEVGSMHDDEQESPAPDNASVIHYPAKAGPYKIALVNGSGGSLSSGGTVILGVD